MSCFEISTVEPCDGGVAVITLTFTDEDDNAVTPDDLQWQLINKHGAIMNSRTFAAGDFTGDTIVLSGDDLTLEDSDDSGVRFLGIKGTYDSSVGTDLPLVGELEFTIQDLKNIPA